MRRYNVLLLVLFTALMGLAGIKTADAEAPFQIALVNPLQLVHETENVEGFRFNVWYGVNSNVSGIDFGFINRTIHDQKGFQLGFFNTTYQMTGLQFGLFNRTEWLDGLQIGLININENSNHRILPLVNWTF